MDIGSNLFIGLFQASISRCIHEVVDVFNRPEMFNAYVKFPMKIEALNSAGGSTYIPIYNKCI